MKTAPFWSSKLGLRGGLRHSRPFTAVGRCNKVHSFDLNPQSLYCLTIEVSADQNHRTVVGNRRVLPPFARRPIKPAPIQLISRYLKRETGKLQTEWKKFDYDP